MPTLRILTNVPVADTARPEFLARASRTVAQMLAKPESCVLVTLEAGRHMLLAGTADPAAYLELKGLGLAQDQMASFSRTLCDLLDETLGVQAERIYIEFATTPHHVFSRGGIWF